MTKLLQCFTLLLLPVFCVFAQSKPVNLYDSAHFYYAKNDFIKAFSFYETYYINHGQSNYDTYYAAVAACHAGNKQRAAYYLEQSASIGYDLSAYSRFADDSLNTCLRELPAWKNFIEPFKIKADSASAALKIITAQLNDTTLRVNHSLLTDSTYWKNLAAQSTPEKLLQSIQHFNQYPSPGRTGLWTLYYLKANDTLTVPFLVYIPTAYKANKKTPLYVFMHGAASGRINFGDPAYEPDAEKNVFERAFEQNAFVLFPFARKDFNWLYHQQAFETIIKEIVQVKSLYNIDDNHVYIGGHSDGGRGAVWFAMNHATPFAAFYGICYYPSLYSSNTFLRNLHNHAPFYGISATKDQLFPLKTVNSIIGFDKKEGGNWKFFMVEGTHGLPYSSPDSIYFLFDSLLTQTRNPFPENITWETDNIQNGRYYWAAITELDTAALPAAWHTPLNPDLTDKEDKTGKAKFNKHKAGAITAHVTGNNIVVTTSCVKALSIYISPGLVDLKKKVTITINGEQKFQGLVKINKQLLLAHFLTTKDRSLIVAEKFSFTLP